MHQVEPCAVPLPSAAAIPYQCYQAIDETAPLAVWQRSLEFRFGRLSHSQWQTLRQTYSQWHNPALLGAYDPQHHYQLMDFLPPAIQALNRHQFRAEERGVPAAPGSPLPKTAQWLANCWSTVYEILRLAHQPQADSPYLFVTAAEPMLQKLRQISRPVTGAAQPGDLWLLTHRHGDREYLDHTVLVIDAGVFFEKAGTGDQVPYRLVDAQTLRAIWHPDVFRYELRRPQRQNKLLPPSRQFSLWADASAASRPLRHRLAPALWSQLVPLPASVDPKLQPSLYWSLALPPLQRSQGRYQLPATAYRPRDRATLPVLVPAKPLSAD